MMDTFSLHNFLKKCSVHYGKQNNNNDNNNNNNRFHPFIFDTKPFYEKQNKTKKKKTYLKTAKSFLEKKNLLFHPFISDTKSAKTLEQLQNHNKTGINEWKIF